MTGLAPDPTAVSRAIRAEQTAPSAPSAPSTSLLPGTPRAVFVLHCDGQKWRIGAESLGPGDDWVFRQETKFPLFGLLAELENGGIAKMGMDMVVALLWYARRKNGEPNLGFLEVLGEFPTYATLKQRGVTIDAELEVG